MSTRALRKLQREQEREKQLTAPSSERKDDHSEGSDDEESLHLIARAQPKKKRKNKLNAFQMLEDEDLDKTKDDDNVPLSPAGKETLPPEVYDVSDHSTPQSTRPKRKKKRKPKDKGKERDSSTITTAETKIPRNKTDKVDEIDRALQELNMRKNQAAAQHDKDATLQSQDAEFSWEKNVSNMLAVDSKHLNPTNEMKSLFGSIALERPNRNHDNADDEGRVGLESALTGKRSPVSRGKELGGLAKRRNIFIQGQENWPLATSGGLVMDLVPDSPGSYGRYYGIFHISTYQDTQRQFRQIVESMSPDAMIHHLIYNPYHIATLLQVSEIAKHQGDHSVSGDLLERALFTFGRSVHSAFGVSIREGRARIPFQKPANRELYLAIWRYLQNLEMRGTWRTAFEWSKMLLSFDFSSDPYGITHTLDQYALRGRQHDALIGLCSEDAFGKIWSHLPNMQISIALAYHRASQPKLARQKLALAMHRYPYILSHLCSTLDISPLPKSLWGKAPSTDAEKFYTELYVTRARDLWSTPETTALLVEVAETLDSYSQSWTNAPPTPKLEISLEDARHVMLLDIPALIALIPRNFRNLPTAQYDVLPPPPSIGDAGLTARAPATADGPGQHGFLGYLAELMTAAARGFRGGGTVGTAAESSNPATREEEHEINNRDLFNTTLTHANLSEEDRTAILAALADDFDPTSQSESEPEELEEPQAQARAQPSGFSPREQLPPTTNRITRPDAIRNYRDEERPPSFFDALLREPVQVREPAGARLVFVPDREAAMSGDTDVDAPPPPDQHRPRPRPTSRSPPPRRMPGFRAPPPAPTVEDEDDDDDEDDAEPNNSASIGGDAVAEASASVLSAAQPSQQRASNSTSTHPQQSQPQLHPQPVNLDPIENNPQRIQRYLLSTGLQNLQSSNPTQAAALQEYTRRLRMLRHRDREWTLGVVRQRVDAAAAAAANGRKAEGSGADLVQRIRAAMG
ncbi:hypothetical protein GJ744_008993 [Endocarpon pusillum]|uniref:DUF654-domain-containing protein n=1 Tax=Endocarpon pusillum TaxID=364733 RepID=A0A8H7AKL7_9EURO|nr:hypothetical protein GJ744_008993 [Endocarpon pusillum]